MGERVGGGGCQPQRIVRDPGMPSQNDIDDHEAGGHATYRTWRGACVGGRVVGLEKGIHRRYYCRGGEEQILGV